MKARKTAHTSFDTGDGVDLVSATVSQKTVYGLSLNLLGMVQVLRVVGSAHVLLTMTLKSRHVSVGNRVCTSNAGNCISEAITDMIALKPRKG